MRTGSRFRIEVTEAALDALADVADVVDDENGLRVLPVLGEGTAQSIADILYLKGIDIGIERGVLIGRITLLQQLLQPVYLDSH